MIMGWSGEICGLSTITELGFGVKYEGILNMRPVAEGQLVGIFQVIQKCRKQELIPSGAMLRDFQQEEGARSDNSGYWGRIKE